MPTDEFEFERQLQRDLPRGRVERPPLSNGERGRFSRWLSPEEMTDSAWSHAKGGLLLGRRRHRFVGWNDDRHVFMVAGNRAGKGRSLLVNNLLLYEGSALVVDPKGELAAITAGRRGKGAIGGRGGLGQDVYVLDPFGVSGRTPHAFNPLLELDLHSPYAVDDAAVLAEALIIHPEHADRHWSEAAQAVITALILLVLAMEKKERNLLTVRRLLSLDHPSIKIRASSKGKNGNDEQSRTSKEEALIDLLIQEEHLNPCGRICAAVGEQLKAIGGGKELGSVLSSARTQTYWLESGKMQDVLCKSDFKLEDLKLRKTTVYLCLPATRMATHARWFRLMISLALTVMERTVAPVDPRVLFVLEEFPVLGHMQAIESAAGQMAGLGVKLWTVIQNFGQIKQHYRDSWENFLANSGVCIAFANSDTTTLEILRKRLGQTAIIERVSSGGVGSPAAGAGLSQREERQVLPLLEEDEIRSAFARPKQAALILTMDHDPAVVQRINYDEDPFFEGLYDEDPRHPKRSGA